MIKRLCFFYSNLVPQVLLKTSSTNVTYDWFHKRYSKLLSQVLLEIDPQTLLKIRFTSVATKVTQN